MRYRPLDIPRTAFEMMRFSKEREAAIKTIIEREREGWGRSLDLPTNLDDDGFWAYWLQKTVIPVTRPLAGSDCIFEQLAPSASLNMSLNGGSEGNTVSLSAVGDLMCTRGLERSKGRLYERVADEVFGADIRFANLESTFASGEIEPLELSAGEGPKINLTEAQYSALIGHGSRRFHIVQLANNHIMDDGEDGLRKTMARLRADGVCWCGVNETPEAAHGAEITEVGGVRVGWVAHTLFLNFRPLPEDKPYLINVTPFHHSPEPDLTRIKEQITWCREKGAVIVVASLHWGLEFEFVPHPDQMKWTRELAEAGADIIIGHHPHVIQGMELISPASQPGKQVPVLYSLGNLTPIFSCPASALSLIARFELSRGEGRTMVTGLRLTPAALVEEDGGERALSLVTLRELYSSDEQDESMRAYIDAMAGYADMTIGRAWRNSAGEES